jgi:hypothetical protein
MPKALLLLILSVFTVGAVADVDKVTLHYGWKPGIYVKVDSYQTQQKIVGEQTKPVMTIDLSYILSTKAHKEGLQIDYMDAKASVLSNDPSINSWMKNYIEMISAAMPSLLISPQGAMLRALELPKFRETMTKSLSDMLNFAPLSQKQQLLSNLDQIFSDSFLNNQFADDWNLNVGQWPDIELEDNDLYEVAYDSPVPVLGNQRVKTVAQVTFAGRVNCDVKDQVQSCVKLIYHSETDSVAMKELLNKVIPPGQATSDLYVSMVMDAELVTDPDTLLPYHMKQTKLSSTPMKTADGFVTVTSNEKSDVTYLYLMGNEKSQRQ